jgi:hypothetical protein
VADEDEWNLLEGCICGNLLGEGEAMIELRIEIEGRLMAIASRRTLPAEVARETDEHHSRL